MSASASTDIELDPDQIRALALRIAEVVSSHLGEQQPLYTALGRPDLEALIPADPPSSGMGPQALVDLLEKDFLRHGRNLRHPRYFSQKVAPLAASVLSDLAMSALNPGTAVYEMGPYSVVLEKKLIRWLARLAGFPTECAGTFVSGGSEANLTALLCARDEATRQAHAENRAPPRLIYACESTHYSVARAAHVLGLGEESVIKIPVDGRFAMDVGALSSALTTHRERSERGVAIVATSSSTSTGSFDALRPIVELGRAHQIWVHVDASHGGSMLLSRELRSKLDGLGEVDSFVVNPHKLMWATTNCSALLIRKRAALAASMAPGLFEASYLVNGSVDPEEDVYDMMRWTLACGRSFAGLRLYANLLVYGVEGLGKMIDHCCAMTRYLHDRIQASEDFEALHAPEANILCFRLIPQSHRGNDREVDRINAKVRNVLSQGADSYLSGVKLGGRYWLRACVSNGATDTAAIDDLLDHVRVTARALEA